MTPVGSCGFGRDRDGRIAALAVVGLLWAALAIPANAQEHGTTGVTVTFDQNRFHVDMLVNPDSIFSKLERLSGRRPQPPAHRPDAIVALGARSDEFLRHIVMQFDDRRVRARLDSIETVLPDATAPLASPRIAIHLSGDVPSGARRFAWSYGLSYAAYRLTVRQHDVAEKHLLVEGEQPAPAIELHGQQSGVRRTGVWGGVVLAVFVALFATRRVERRKRRNPTRLSAVQAHPQTMSLS